MRPPGEDRGLLLPKLFIGQEAIVVKGAEHADPLRNRSIHDIDGSLRFGLSLRT